MEIKDIRRAVLRSLIKQKHDNVVRQFALAIKKPDGQLNDMLSTPPRKSFGERIARAIERAYGLESGYLDKPENIKNEINEYETLKQHPSPARTPENKVTYGQFNSVITEVIELMEAVDAETQRDILGAVRVANTEYRMKNRNSTQLAGQ